MSWKEVLIIVKSFFKNRIITSQNYGLTHGEHREANVITDGQQVHFIDFDLPSMTWLTEDVYRPFFNPIIHDKTDWYEKLPLYLEGYFTQMPQARFDKEIMAMHIRLKCLEIYLWTKNNWSDETAPGGTNTKVWLDKIHEKLIDQRWTEKL